MDKAIFKFNNGNGALLCSGCRVKRKNLPSNIDKKSLKKLE